MIFFIKNYRCINIYIYILIDTLCSKSAQLSLRGTVVKDDIIEESDTSKYQEQNGLLNVTIKPKIQLDQKLPITMTMKPVQNEGLKVGVHVYACIINIYICISTKKYIIFYI